MLDFIFYHSLIVGVVVFMLVGAWMTESLRYAFSGKTFIRNEAFAVRQVGLYLGVFAGSLAVAENVFFTGNVYQLILEFFMVLLAMFTALFFADRLLLGSIDNDEAIRKNNLAVAFSEAGILIATGFVLYGSILGSGPFWTAIVFFIFGQLIFLGASFALEMPYRGLRSKIKIGEIDAGIFLGSITVSLGMIVSSSVEGKFTGLVSDLVASGVYFFGVLALFIPVFLIEMLARRVAREAYRIEWVFSSMRIAYTVVLIVGVDSYGLYVL